MGGGSKIASLRKRTFIVTAQILMTTVYQCLVNLHIDVRTIQNIYVSNFTVQPMPKTDIHLKKLNKNKFKKLKCKYTIKKSSFDAVVLM